LVIASSARSTCSGVSIIKGDLYNATWDHITRELVDA
jgi:hypothetical protein